MPGPRSTTRRSTRPSHRARRRRATGDRRRRPRDRVRRRGWRAPARAAPGRHSTARQRLGHVDARRRRAARRGSRARRDTTSSRPIGRERELRARRPAAGSCRAGCRRAGRAGRSRRRSSRGTRAASSARPVDVVLPQARDRGLDRGERRAQVVRDGLQERGAQLVRLREPSACRGCRPRARPRSRPTASWARERVEHRRSAGQRRARAARARRQVAERSRRRAVRRASPAARARRPTPRPATRRRLCARSTAIASEPNDARRCSTRLGSGSRRRRSPRAARAPRPRHARALPSAARRAASVDEGAHDDGDRRGRRTSARAFSPLDRQGVERRREVVVGEQEAADRGDEPRPEAADRRGADRTSSR